MMKVYPAILEKTREEVEKKVGLVKGLVKRVQLDVIDGLFADNLTVTPEDLETVEWGNLGVDVHLMVDDPMEWVEACLKLPKVRIIAQAERLGSQEVFVDWIKGYKEIAGVGLALDVTTPIAALSDGVLNKIEAVVLLAVKAGFQGQKFNEKVVGKARELRKKFKGEIVVDGGIDETKIEKLVRAGVNGVAVGSYLWETEQTIKRIIELRKVNND